MNESMFGGRVFTGCFVPTCGQSNCVTWSRKTRIKGDGEVEAKNWNSWSLSYAAAAEDSRSLFVEDAAGWFSGFSKPKPHGSVGRTRTLRGPCVNLRVLLFTFGGPCALRQHTLGRKRSLATVGRGKREMARVEFCGADEDVVVAAEESN